MNQTMGRADLHMHTRASDGQATVQQVLSYVAKHRPQLDVIAITDHDTLEASLWAYEHRADYPFEIIPGLEVSSRAGHVLALWVTTPIPKNLSLSETVQAIHEAGGLAILAHPFHVEMEIVRENALRFWHQPHLLHEAQVDAIETHNSGGILPFTRLAARLWAERVGLPQVGNSDAHTLGAIGSGQTRFPGRSADDLRQAIAQGLTQAEGSPWPLRDMIDYALFMREYHQVVQYGQA
jgi:predicted metal-dependent phosphoesterase TrpH